MAEELHDKAKFDVAAIAEFLSKKLPTTEVLQRDVAVRCFTGKKLLEFLQASTHKTLKDVRTPDQARWVASRLAESEDPVFMYRVAVRATPKQIFCQPTGQKGFALDGKAVYVWAFKGSQTFNHVMLASILLVILVCCLFPIWPRWAKLGALAVSAGLLVLLLGSILFRALLGYGTWMLGYEVWILPNVFDEAESFSELFYPYIAWGWAPKSHRWYRLALFGLVCAFGYWVYTQPSEFDRFITTQRDFVTNLYEGAFVADKSEQARQHEDGDLPPKKDTFKDLFEDLVGKPEMPAEEGDDAFDFEAGLDELMDDE